MTVAHQRLTGIAPVPHVRTRMVSASAIFVVGTVLTCGPALAQEPAAKLRHSGAVRALDFSPAANILATVSQDDRVIRLWEPATGKVLGIIPALPGGADFVAFAPDGRLLAYGGVDQTVTVWDRQAAKEYRRLQGHDKVVSCVAFSPDGRFLATAGGDRMVILWQVVWIREVSRFAHPGPVNSVAFSGDGRFLASGCADALARVWAIDKIAVPQPPKPGKTGKKSAE